MRRSLGQRVVQGIISRLRQIMRCVLTIGKQIDEIRVQGIA